MSAAARKIAAIIHCVERAHSERSLAGDNFERDLSRQDAAVLNVTRACEAAIDLANMLIRKRRIGIPGDARESFALLERANIIEPALSGVLRRMVGFRNIAVHQYQDLDLDLDLDLDIVDSVIQKNLDDLLAFAEIARGQLNDV